MDRKSGAVGPCRFGCGKERETFPGATLHFHQMGDNVNGARMSGVEGKCAPRCLFGATILTVLLEAERVHGKHAGVAGHRRLPLRQHLCDAIAEHTPPAEAEIERMRDHQRENVTRPVDDDGAVTFKRKHRIAVEPGARRGRVTIRAVVRVWTRRLDGGDAHSKRRSRGGLVGTDNERGAQTMAEHPFGVVGKHPLDLQSRIPAMRKQHLERSPASLQRIRADLSGRGRC